MHSAIRVRYVPGLTNFIQEVTDYYHIVRVDQREIYFFCAVTEVDVAPFYAVVQSVVFVIYGIALCADLTHGAFEVFATFEHLESCYDQCFCFGLGELEDFWQWFALVYVVTVS